MMGNEEAERLRSLGLDVETVGDLLDDRPAAPVAPFTMPVLDGYPVDFPEPGIYFGMPEEVYHAVPALSTGGVKKAAASAMLFWATCEWLNPEAAELKREEDERRQRDGVDHFDVGRAYHARILEGREAFDARFVAALDKADYPHALTTLDDIKAAFPEGIKPKGKTKREVFEHLRTLDATAELWEDIKAAHEAAHPDRCFISHKVRAQLEKAATMIERDPELNKAFTGGYPEVSLFWICEQTGMPMKARCDYLKLKAVVDLKTVQNSKDQAIENAIRFDIANRRYAIQPAVYLEGVDAVRKLVRQRSLVEKNGLAAFGWDHEQGEAYDLGQGDQMEKELIGWVKKWAAHQGDTEWLWIYQQKGIAPVTRGVFLPVRGTTMMLCKDIVTMMKRRVRTFAETLGTDPWIDSKPIYDLADEDLPPWATEI